jgi:hypothetical protein
MPDLRFRCRQSAYPLGVRDSSVSKGVPSRGESSPRYGGAVRASILLRPGDFVRSQCGFVLRIETDTMKLEIGHLHVTELLQMVKNGRLALPEFQRDFVWKPVDVCDLLMSVARKWPIGSFLVMEAKGCVFQLRSLDQAPPLADVPELVVLDGQQRCTAFFHAFTDNSPDVVFYLKFPDDWETFSEDLICYEKKQRFAKRYPNLERMAADRVIKIWDLHNDERFEEWKEHLHEKDDRTRAVAFRSNQVAGLKDILVPHSKLSGEPDLRAIAKIFETINRTGKRLDTFDLLVARLYPYDFRLRDKWEDAQAEHEEFQTFEIDGLEVLKLIALRQHISESGAGRSSDVKGVKQSDVLMLEPETVQKEWNLALNAYVEGLKFLKERCGVVSSHLLPQPSVPLTVGYFHASDCDLRRDFKSDLERWYWASCFKQTYAQGANTQVLQDVKTLRAWNSDEGSVPVVVSNFTIAAEQLREGRRLNEMLLRGILGRQISRGAKDWSTGKPVSEAPSVEIHHVFPADFLKTLRGNATIPKDPILNFVAISGATNKKIRNESPAQVVRRSDIKASWVKTHGLEEPWLAPRAGETDVQLVDRFLESRLTVVKELIETAVMGE